MAARSALPYGVHAGQTAPGRALSDEHNDVVALEDLPVLERLVNSEVIFRQTSHPPAERRP